MGYRFKRSRLITVILVSIAVTLLLRHYDIPGKSPETYIRNRLLALHHYDGRGPIETNIWQIWSSTDTSQKDEFPETCISLVDRWKDANSDYEHHLVNINEVQKWVQEELSDVPEVVVALDSLPDERIKMEFLKYLLVYIRGGLYADIDTIDIRPLEDWKAVFLASEAPTPPRLAIGIASDFNHDNWQDYYNRRIVFSTSLFMSKQHHPFLAALIARITSIALKEPDLIATTDWRVALYLHDANGDPTVQFTGPSIFSDVFLDYLHGLNFPSVVIDPYDREMQSNTKIYGPSTRGLSYANLSLLTHPVYINDMAVLPQLSFGGYENVHDDSYETGGEGYESLFYGRPMSMTKWSKRKVRLDGE